MSPEIVFHNLRVVRSSRPKGSFTTAAVCVNNITACVMHFRALYMEKNRVVHFCAWHECRLRI